MGCLRFLLCIKDMFVLLNNGDRCCDGCVTEGEGIVTK